METCIYNKGITGSNRIIRSIHGDDQAIAGPNKQVITKFKQEMGEHFKMKDLGPLTHILGGGRAAGWVGVWVWLVGMEELTGGG